MIKAALFDLDGVVFDTEPQYSLFWGAQFQHYYPGQSGLEASIKGQTLDSIYAQYFADDKDARDQITAALNEFECKMDYPYVVGLEDFVHGLHDAGIKTAIVTSSNRPKMHAVTAKHPELNQLFDAILTSEDFAYSKPHPDCYLRAAKRFDAEPDRCVGFEDSFNGLKAVRAAGMYTVALATTNPHEKLAPLSDCVVDNFTHLNINHLIDR